MALTTGRVKAEIQFTETVTANIGASASDAVLNHNLSLNQTIPNGTTLPATIGASFTQALASSTATISLLALPKANGATSDCSGLKMQALMIKNPTGNGTLTYAHSTSTAASAYAFLGTAGAFTLPAGATLLWQSPESAPDVTTSATNIAITGTGSQTFHVAIVAG